MRFIQQQLPYMLGSQLVNKDLQNKLTLSHLEARIEQLRRASPGVMSWDQYREAHPAPGADGPDIGLAALGFAILGAAIAGAVGAMMGGIPLALVSIMAGTAAIGGAIAGAWTALELRSPVMREGKQIEHYERYVAQKEQEALMSGANRASQPQVGSINYRDDHANRLLTGRMANRAMFTIT
jgi:hypothetical protein